MDLVTESGFSDSRPINHIYLDFGQCRSSGGSNHAKDPQHRNPRRLKLRLAARHTVREEFLTFGFASSWKTRLCQRDGRRCLTQVRPTHQEVRQCKASDEDRPCGRGTKVSALKGPVKSARLRSQGKKNKASKIQKRELNK